MGGDSINIYNLDCLVGMKDLGDESIDLITTDPPYGIAFMGKDWDKFNEIVDPQGAYAKKKGFKKLPRQNTISMTEFFIPIWKECLRILKPGAFAFVMCSPRADVMAKQVCCLQDAGFLVNFTPIYWAYASGFPKAQNIGKTVDKRLGNEREVVGKGKAGAGMNKVKGFGVNTTKGGEATTEWDETKGNSPLEGSYGGFQPKPAVEVIIVAMKPLSEKTFVDQALKNRKGITWLDDCRIPYIDERDIGDPDRGKGYPMLDPKRGWHQNKIVNDVTIGEKGRFPANLLVSDDVLNDGRVFATHQATMQPGLRDNWVGKKNTEYEIRKDSGSFSRYFDLDKWWAKTFPFLIVPKASKSEKNRGVDTPKGETPFLPSGAFETDGGKKKHTMMRNYHPTVKPVKLFSYLVTLGSRAGDVVLDPFGGTMTTAVACAMLGREFIGYEIDAGSYEISQGRVKAGWQIKLEALGGKE